MWPLFVLHGMSLCEEIWEKVGEVLQYSLNKCGVLTEFPHLFIFLELKIILHFLRDMSRKTTNGHIIKK